jgi:hypothetical protein
MANVLQFDGAGRVDFPEWDSGIGDFTVTIDSVTYVDAAEIIIGHMGNIVNFVACINGGIIRFRGGGGADIDVSGHTPGETISITVQRVGSTITLTTTAGSTFKGGATSAVLFNSFGEYQSGLIYNGIIGDTVGLTNGSVRSYDTNQPLLSTTLPDTLDAQDGTLVNFTVGGFIVSPDPFITITAPLDNQFYKRDANGDAIITVTGTMSNVSPAPPSIEYRKDKGAWSVLDAAPTSSTFSGPITLNGQGTIEVRISDDVGVTDSSSNVSSAVVLVQAGQSNTSGRGDENQIVYPCGGFVPLMSNLSSDLLLMSDPTGTEVGLSAGSFLPGLANRYVERGFPVAMINVAVGGTTISQWQKPSTNYTNITNALGVSINGSSGLVFNLGESDAVAGTLEVSFKADLNALIDDVFADFGVQTYIVKIVQGTTIPQPAGDNIRQWQNDVIASNANALDGGDLSTIDIDSAPSADNLHLKTNENLEDAAEIIFQAIAPRANLALPFPLKNSLGVIQGPIVDADVSVCLASDMSQTGTSVVSWGGDGLLAFDQVGAVAGVTYALTIRVDSVNYANAEVVAT